MSLVRTTCPYCGVGCGVTVDTASGKMQGDTAHPANGGRLCSKGANLAGTLDDTTRLTTPLVHGRAASWDDALDLVAKKFAETIARHGPDSVAFYLSGQFLTEDYYVANKLMKGFIGSANIDTNSRLCMASTVAGHIRAFGEDVVPGIYDDLENADLIVLVGSNTAWCHPVLHQRLQAARAHRGTPRVVAIDPRRTATAEAADLHLPIASGTDVALFNGLLAYLADSDALDPDFISRHTEGLAAALAQARCDPADTDHIAAACGIDPELLDTFFGWFATTPRTVTIFSQGVNQAVDGTDRVNAIINCHLATGRIGKPGTGPFSVTGQPNAMGGREAGGLSNQLAAHLDPARPADRETLRSFWQSPFLPAGTGLKAIDLFEAVADGRIKAIWIAATNPAASMPNAGAVAAALKACPFVVAADCWPTDTTALAHVVLPAAAWGEKNGTVTNSERCISRQRPFRAAPGDAQPDWWMFRELARRLGHADAFDYGGPACIFREHAALSAYRNTGGRMFNIGALAAIGDDAYDALAPMRWPIPPGASGEGGRLFSDGIFPTETGRARFVAVRHQSETQPHPANLEELFLPNSFVLNTGRVRDQWHTMTRTGLVPELARHTPEPMAAINPSDAIRLGIGAGHLVRIETEQGAIALRADLRHEQRRGEIFVPMHWTRHFAATGPVAQLTAATCDPVSGQPALKSTRARLTPAALAWHGLLLTTDTHAPAPAGGALWTRIPLGNGTLFRLAGGTALPQGAALAQLIDTLLDAPGAERLDMEDARRTILRAAALADGALRACLLIAPTRALLPDEDIFAALLGTKIEPAARAGLLAGRGNGEARGRTVCACFGVDEGAIRHTAVTGHLGTAKEIGACLRAGTNCGSCIPEIEMILREVRQPAGDLKEELLF